VFLPASPTTWRATRALRARGTASTAGSASAAPLTRLLEIVVHSAAVDPDGVFRGF
jgi:hypothetical protein